MLVVVMLLPLSSPMYDGEFDHGGGGGGCGSLAAVAVEAVEDNLSAKAAGNESVDGRMTACDDEIGRRTTTQEPTNERRCGGGGSGSGGAQRDGGRRWTGRGQGRSTA
jgi:hypothetical protein